MAGRRASIATWFGGLRPQPLPLTSILSHPGEEAWSVGSDKNLPLFQR